MRKPWPEHPRPCSWSATGWGVSGLGQHPTSSAYLLLAFSLHSCHSLFPLGSQASFSRTKGLAAIQGRITHQSPPPSLLREFPSRLASGPQVNRSSLVPGPLSCSSILRSCSRSLLLTCRVGHVPWERGEGGQGGRTLCTALVAEQPVLSTSSIPSRRKFNCDSHQAPRLCQPLSLFSFHLAFAHSQQPQLPSSWF